jgi:hypothetical protein
LLRRAVRRAGPPGDVPAVHGQERAGDVPGGGRTEKKDSIGNLVGLGSAPHGIACISAVTNASFIRGATPGFRGISTTPRGDAVDVDLVLGRFHREHLREHHDACLRGTVGGAPSHPWLWGMEEIVTIRPRVLWATMLRAAA